VGIESQIISTQIAAWVRTWCKPTDHLYLAGSFFKLPDLNVFGTDSIGLGPT